MPHRLPFFFTAACRPFTVVLAALALPLGASAQLSFRGFYSGALSSGGSIGLYVNANADVSVIVVDPLSNSFGASNAVKAAANGTFTGVYSLTTISGQIAPNGNVTGTASGVGLNFTARRAPLAGPTQAFEGYYEGWVFDPNNRLLATSLAVSADGLLYMFIQDGPDVVDAGYGTIDARGIFSVRDSRGRVSSGSIITSAAGLAWNGRFSKTGVGAYTFVVGKRTAADKFVNISTRGKVEPGAGAMFAGFAVTGGAKTLLIRGVGPGLAAFGVGDALPDPVLTLFLGSEIIATNDNWSVTAATTTLAEVRDTAARLGAFAFAANSKDSALLIRLEPGLYTARLSDATDQTGVGLIEVYEVQ
ncbi:MAG: hypothetical protein RLZZ15_218 [Verrucomicrobiota bacterium]|jgi:hypothetical protein